MAELTADEADVRDVARRLVRIDGQPVRPNELTKALRLHGFPMSYSRVCRALAGLTAKGLLSKPRRGFYLPTEENA